MLGMKGKREKGKGKEKRETRNKGTLNPKSPKAHLLRYFHCSESKVNPNCGNVRLREGIIGKTKEEAGLTHARVANQDQLEQMVVVPL